MSADWPWYELTQYKRVASIDTSRLGFPNYEITERFSQDNEENTVAEYKMGDTITRPYISPSLRNTFLETNYFCEEVKLST